MAAVGLTYNDIFLPDPLRANTKQQKEYIYYNENSERLYRVVKYLDQDGNKTFRQQAAIGDSWAHTMGQTRRVLYYLPRVRAAIDLGRTIWIVEGEKDVENLSFQTGAIATCNPGGADPGTGGKFTAEMVDQLRGARRISIIIDNDLPGERHARYLAEQLASKTVQVTVWRSPTHKDISDHLAAGHGLADLEALYDSMEPNGWLHIEPLEDITQAPNPDENGWQLQSLDQWLDGTYEETVPTILERNDGHSLFYAGKINSIFGESGSGKTWVLMIALAQAITRGENTAYIDFEDRPTTLVTRLRILGIEDQEIRAHCTYAHPWAMATGQEIENLVQTLDDRQVTVLGIDSAGEALALAELNPNADEEVATWYREIPRRLADTGSCIILVDHIPKNTEHSKLHAIGSQRKKAALDGASYAVKCPNGFSIEPSPDPGRIELYCAKDRHGTYPNGQNVATIIVTDLSEGRKNMVVVNPKDPMHRPEEDHDLLEAICAWWIEQPDGLASGAEARLYASQNGLQVKAWEQGHKRLKDLGHTYPVGQKTYLKTVYKRPVEPAPNSVGSTDTISHASTAPPPSTTAPPLGSTDNKVNGGGNLHASTHPYLGGGVEEAEDRYNDEALFEQIDDPRRFQG
jgi:5S rRNA maturation endonuclease (ribonuclease M5)